LNPNLKIFIPDSSSGDDVTRDFLLRVIKSLLNIKVTFYNNQDFLKELTTVHSAIESFKEEARILNKSFKVMAEYSKHLALFKLTKSKLIN
jgi:hypothetical protein